MAQRSLNEEAKHNENESQSQASQVQTTLDRIVQMEAQLQSTKEGFMKTIWDLGQQIQSAAREEARNPSAPKPDTGYARAEADCKEFFDEPSVLQQKVKKLASLIKTSKHFIAYTGAGISTACGIADYRSGVNTVLDTGAGKWAKQAAMKQGTLSKEEVQKARKKKKTSTFKAVPSAAHMALVALARAGYLKHLISQNTDGLHRRSGFPIDQLSELHGNSTLELCPMCGKAYMRDFRCSNKETVPQGAVSKLKYLMKHITDALQSGTIYASKMKDADKKDILNEIQKAQDIIQRRREDKKRSVIAIKDEIKKVRKRLQDRWDTLLESCGFPLSRPIHHTGRYCTVRGCGRPFGQLQDTIINFGESLPEKPLREGGKAAEAADLCLVLGSSCTVTPAADMPELVGERWEEEAAQNAGETEHNLVICNLQKTPLHHLCSLPIFSKIDAVMIGVMKELKLEIPRWYLQRYIQIGVTFVSDTQRSLCISGIDLDGTPFTLFKSVVLRHDGKRIRKIINNKENREHEYNYIVPLWNKDNDNDDEEEQKKGDHENEESDESDAKGLRVELTFCGNYQESKLVIGLNEYLDECVENDGVIALKMIMDPATKVWNVPNKKEQMSDKGIKALWRIGNRNDDNQADVNSDQ